MATAKARSLGLTSVEARAVGAQAHICGQVEGLGFEIGEPERGAGRETPGGVERVKTARLGEPVRGAAGQGVFSSLPRPPVGWLCMARILIE